ncbi:MAG: CotH kinase family protein [Coprococcus sp.]
MKLLLAEDEVDMSEALVDILTYHKYTVDAVFDGEEALDYATIGEYDGIILDIMMPKMSGLEVLQKLRNRGDRTPVLLLTAKAEVEDRIAGLDMGADDYLPKPFAMGELLARIQAMLRRKEEFTPEIVKCGDLSLIYSDDEYNGYSNIFDNAKTDITDEDKERLIASLKSLNENSDIENVVNVDEVIRYFVVHNFVCNFDSYTGSMIHNYYLYEEDGQLSMIPWDYNLAFGGFSAGGGGSDSATQMVNYPIDTPVSGGTIDSRPMLAWIFADESYTELYHTYFDTFISEYFESGYFENLITETENLIASYVEQDPTKFCTYEEFETGVDTLKSFCLLRAESIRGQLDGTIPSTSDGQQEDDSALVDASSISLTDMGSMGHGGGTPGGGERPD